MKYFTFIGLVLITATFSSAQIPNSGFENWIDEITPAGWTTNNFPSAWTPVTRSSESYSGTYSARMEIAQANGFPIPAVLQVTFPCTPDYKGILGYMKFNPLSSGVVLSLYSFIYRNGSLTAGRSIDFKSAVNSFTYFNLDPDPNSTEIPDSVWLQFELISDDPISNPGIGSYALIDGLSSVISTGIKNVNNIPADFNLEQNYPNPFNPETTIEFTIPEQSFVRLNVFDMLGNEVAVLVNDFYTAGKYKVDFIAENLSSGIYIARIKAGTFIQTRKMILLR